MKLSKLISLFVLIGVVLTGWGNDKLGATGANEKILKAKNGAVFIEGLKQGNGDYVPIFYKLRWSKDDAVCDRLLGVVNADLKSSPYVDYANTEHFKSWTLLKQSTWVRNDLKPWHNKYRAPVAKLTVDIDNDGALEYLYLITRLDPYAKQSIYILKKQPTTEPRIDEDPMRQSALFREFVTLETETGNTVGQGIWIRSPMWLEELPKYSVTRPTAFFGESSAYFIFRHYGHNYLVSDTLNYDPNSKRGYENNPWLLLFTVSNEGQLNKTCILKRTH